VFGKAPLILVLASRFRDTLIDMGFKPDQIRVITTMFDGSMFTGINRQDNDSPSLLFLSRFIPEKGIYELFEAFAGLTRRFPDLSLVMAGDGPERKRMVQWVQAHGLTDRVRFPGYLRGPAKAHALLNAEMFVFPTYHCEGCPVSLLEAMAAGLPVVTTRAGGIPDIFRDGENGILLKEVSPASIEHAIEKLLNNRQLSMDIRSNNLNRSWRTFEARVVTKKFENIYRFVADGN
jgi:glycosyltransferase involved in cell wall biosynthesis